MQTTRKLDFIQALRGVAALMVVLSHTRNYFLDAPNGMAIRYALIWGGGGVDLFFVISGFIMVYTTRDSDGSAAYVRWFALKRVAKVWPPYLIVTLVWVFVGREGFSYFVHEAAHLIRSVLFLPIQASNPMYLGSALMTLPVGWTLNYEVYFYIVFGLSMLFGKWRWIALSAPMAWMLIAVPWLSGSLTLDPLQPSTLRSAYLSMMTNPLIWDFLAGVAIGKIYLSKLQVASERALLLTLFACLSLYTWSFLTNTGANDGMARWGAYASVTVLCLSLLSKTREIHMPRCLVALGDVSYSLYLSHEIALTAVTAAIVKAGYSSEVGTFAHVVLTTSAAIVLAFIISPFIERRMHDLVLSGFRKRAT